MCAPTRATSTASCLVEALGQTVWDVAFEIAYNERAVLSEMEESRERALAAATASDQHPSA
jgi:hypothetical protein